MDVNGFENIADQYIDYSHFIWYDLLVLHPPLSI